MHNWFLQPIAPIFFGLIFGFFAFGIRHYILSRPRTVNYFSVFMSASAGYVFLIMLINHKIYNATYAGMLDSGFGVDEVTFAFLFSAYHFGKEIWGKITRSH